MRRLIMCVTVICMSLGTTGCVGAIVTKNRFSPDRELVAVNGQVYVVDKSNGSVMRVDVSSATPFVPASDTDVPDSDSD